MNMKFLPNKIRWISVYDVSPTSYQEVLVVTHKHNANDWYITMGWIEPIDNYSDFKVYSKSGGISKHYPDYEVEKSDVIAIGLILPSYGMNTRHK